MTENIASYDHAASDPIARIENSDEVKRARGAIAAMHNMVAADYRIGNADQYQAAAEDLTRLKKIARDLEDLRTGYVAPLNLEVKGINGLFRVYSDQLDTVERTIKAAISAFTQAERARIAKEQADADERARRAREALAAKAAEAEAAGRVEKAEHLQARAADTVAPVMQPRIPTTKGMGVSVRKVWKYRIRDASKLPPEFLMPNEPKIASYVRAMKESASIEGVEIYWEDSVAGRSA